MEEIHSGIVIDSEEMSKLREDVDKLRHDVKSLISSARSAGLDIKGNSHSRLGTIVSGIDERVKGSVSDAYRNVVRQGDKVFELTRHTVSKKPVAVAAVAAFVAAGAVLTWLAVKK